MWLPLIEKAAAKFLGSYEAINGGLEESAFSMLLGAPYESFYQADYTADEIWTLIRAGEARNAMITTGSYLGDGNDQLNNRNGVPYAHAFTVLQTLTLKDGAIKLVKIRNPWNFEFYSGDWSDQSHKWTE